jgi:hypothetical protein
VAGVGGVAGDECGGQVSPSQIYWSVNPCARFRVPACCACLLSALVFVCLLAVRLLAVRYVAAPAQVRDMDALKKTAEDSQKRAASAVAIRPTSADSSGGGQLVRHAPGKVPDYILQRKEHKRLQEQREEELRARRALVPDGFRVVSDSERASAESQTRILWQQAMGHFMRIPHDTRNLAQVKRRQELEKSIQALEQQLQVLSVEGGGALLVPEGLLLVPTSLQLASKEAPMTEGQRIKMLQCGPPII